MDKDIAEMAAAIEQAFAADPICGGRFCSGTAEAAAIAAYAVVQAKVERLTRPLVGIEHRSGEEAFEIVCHRIRCALNPTGDNHAE